MSIATAWAVVENGKILVNTVDGTRRGSIIKFCLECLKSRVEEDLFMLSRFDDTQIEEIWANHKALSAICTVINLVHQEVEERPARRRPKGS